MRSRWRASQPQNPMTNVRGDPCQRSAMHETADTSVARDLRIRLLQPKILPLARLTVSQG